LPSRHLSLLKDNKDKPFFAYVPFTYPPLRRCTARTEYHDPWRKKFPEFEKKIGKYSGPKVTNPIAAFAGMVTLLDEHVGQILALLKELGIDDNTIVSFTSDNGPHMEGGHNPKFFDSNGPLKGHKRDLYEGGIRVPFIARWPGKIKPGTTCDLPVAMWDFMPTAAELAGIDAPKGIDGISYLSALLGDMDKQKKHEYLFWAFYERGGKVAVRMGKWKGIRNNVNKNPDSTLELYDLSQDIGETKNIAADQPEIVKKLDGFIKDAYAPSDLWSFGGKKKKK